MIQVYRCQSADTRSCDYKNVSKEELLKASLSHIGDVCRAMGVLIRMMDEAAKNHDRTKISHIDDFHKDFIGGFVSTAWWNMHKNIERHHYQSADKVPDDLNLIDVIESLVDGVVAGMARNGSYNYYPISTDLLQMACENTAMLLKKNIEIVL